MAVEGELCLVTRSRPRSARRAVLQVGLALLATEAFGDLAWSLARAPRWVAGLDATYAAVLGLVLTGLARTFRSMQAYRDRTARAQALVRSYVPAPVAEGILDADRAADIALHRRRGVLLDHATWNLVRAHLRCVPRGEIRVKGVGEQLRVYEAGGCSPTLTS